MYKIQEACDNCRHCNFVGHIEICFNKASTKYNKEVDVAGICELFEKGVYWEEKDESEI